MNNNIEWEHKNDKKIKNKEFKRMKKLLLSKEEEELLYLMGKNNFANQISMTDLNLLPNNDNNKKRNNKNNVNLVNQIGLVYNKIYEKDKYRKINNKKLLDDIFKNNSEIFDNSYICNNKDILSENKEERKKTKRRNLPKIIRSQFSKDNGSNKLYKSRKDIKIPNNISYFNNELTASNVNNRIHSENKFKQYYYLIKNNKNKSNRKLLLPPINNVLFKCHKLKLNINNEIDPTDEKHEEMMKLYKEIEIRNKNRFVI